MNIAIFSDTYLPDINGVATSCNTLFHILRKHGHKVYVVAPGEKFEFNDNILRIPGLELKNLYGYRLSFIWDEQGFQILKNLNLDLVHINTDFGVGQFGMNVANKLSIPIYSITFGDSSEDELNLLANLSNAKVFDGKSGLLKAFKEVRSYN